MSQSPPHNNNNSIVDDDNNNDNNIMYIYHVLIDTLNTHMIRINLNTVFYTHVEQSPTYAIYTKYYF